MFACHLLLDPYAYGRILKTLEQFLTSAIGYPWWQARGKRSCSSYIGIHVGRHILSRIPGGLDHRHDFWHRAPVRFTNYFEMKDFHRQMSFAADAKCFFHGWYFALTLAPHMAGVESSVLSGHLGQLDQLLRLGVMSGRVDKRGGNAEGSLVHRLLNKGFHFFQLVGSWRAVHVSQHGLANLCRPNIGSDIEGSACFLKPGKI